MSPDLQEQGVRIVDNYKRTGQWLFCVHAVFDYATKQILNSVIKR